MIANSSSDESLLPSLNHRQTHPSSPLRRNSTTIGAIGMIVLDSVSRTAKDLQHSLFRALPKFLVPLEMLEETRVLISSVTREWNCSGFR